ncbi:MAG: 3-methyl-2-oxobutanoate dehydrogenase subunit VorB [Christensenellaceae bacterium]|nr:3-methyl-2-oxobutanoate dehydrogenase subunit VorB [Christensenellaceae bacterium]
MAKKLMKGSEAIAEAAIQAGCRFFFGYPITPQNQIPEYMSKRMPQVDGCFLQAESEVAAINMVYGAAGAGARVMTSSSSPGISLKQEGISYIACAELPCVVCNIVRTGPGLGGIQPSQGDYFQATKGGGHGDYHLVVLAPSSVQEAADLVMEAFDIADMYRNPVMILGDGMIGQMMEPVEFKEPKKRQLPEKTWAATGWDGSRDRAIINSLYIEPEVMKVVSDRLQQRYATIAKNEVRVEEYMMDDAEYCIAAYGTIARIAKSAIAKARAMGIKVGLIRPITVWPFPSESYKKAAEKVDAFLTVEMSAGQMVEDVRLAVDGKKPVEFYGVMGGFVPTPEDILEQIIKMKEGK